MKRGFILSITVLLIFLCSTYALEGFYKDVFVDAGTNIKGPSSMPAIKYIGCTEEWMVIYTDTATQLQVMFTNTNDENGRLLYPDGKPRFAVIYYHGGSMAHSTQLGAAGRAYIKQHYYKGGSQCGSCAGSYMLSSSSTNYFRLWPGTVSMSPNASNTTLNVAVPSNSPLLKYYNFGGNGVIENVYHNNGGCVDTTKMPSGTEILTTHTYSAMNGYGACWAWKDKDTTGRVIGITSHPEGTGSGEGRDYMAGVLRYCIDGLGKPEIKAVMNNGDKRNMNKATKDNDPKFTKIGDLQYHHFSVKLTEPVSNLRIAVTADSGITMHLFAAKDTFAFAGKAPWADTSAGASKTLTVPKAEAGLWDIGVKCATTVTATQKTSGQDKYWEYSGKIEVLNGIAYTIQVTWDATDILAHNTPSIADRFAMSKAGKTVYFAVGTGDVRLLQVFDLKGRVCWEPKLVKGVETYSWQPGSAGLYIVKIGSGKEALFKRLTVTM